MNGWVGRCGDGRRLEGKKIPVWGRSELMNSRQAVCVQSLVYGGEDDGEWIFYQWSIGSDCSSNSLLFQGDGYLQDIPVDGLRVANHHQLFGVWVSAV
jgi:hypothetical protein